MNTMTNTLNPAEASAKTVKLQEQFICQIWTVWYGKRVDLYHTQYHAKQMVRALTLNGTPCLAFDGKGAAI